MRNFREAYSAAESKFKQIKDPFLRDASQAIFNAKPATGPKHAELLAKYCSDNKKTPRDFLNGMYSDTEARRQLLEAVNAAHEVVGARILGEDEFAYNWLKSLVEVSEQI